MRKGNGVTTAFPASADTDAARGAAAIAASAAAVSGDTVFFAPGRSYTINQNIAKNGVTYFGTGCTIVNNGSATAPIFYDGGSAIAITVRGNINFTSTINGDAATDTLGIAKQTNTGSNFDIECGDLTLAWVDGPSHGTNEQAWFNGVGKLRFVGGNITHSNALDNNPTYIFWWRNGRWDISFTDAHCEVANAATFLVYAQILASAATRTADCNLFLNFNHISAGFGSIVAFADTTAQTVIPAVWVNGDFYEGQIQLGGGVKFYLTTQKYNGSILISNGNTLLDSQFFVSTQKWTNSLVGFNMDLSDQWLQVNGVVMMTIICNLFEPVTGNNLMLGCDDAGFISLMAGELPGAPGFTPISVSSGTFKIITGNISSDAGQSDIIQSGGVVMTSAGVRLTPSKVTGTVIGPQFPQHVVAAGTAYTLTNTSAAVTFGTTSPVTTLAATGDYIVRAFANYQYTAATFAASRAVTTKLRRTNNTAADLTNSSVALATDIVTAKTATFIPLEIEGSVYAGTAGDVISVFADVAVVPTAGSLQIVGAWIDARLVA